MIGGPFARSPLALWVAPVLLVWFVVTILCRLIVWVAIRNQAKRETAATVQTDTLSDSTE